MPNPQRTAELRKLFAQNDENYKNASWGAWYPPEGEYVCELSNVSFSEETISKNKASVITVEYQIVEGELQGRKFKDSFNNLKSQSGDYWGIARFKALVDTIYPENTFEFVDAIDWLIDVSEMKNDQGSYDGPIVAVKVEQVEGKKYKNLEVLSLVQ